MAPYNNQNQNQNQNPTNLTELIDEALPFRNAPQRYELERLVELARVEGPFSFFNRVGETVDNVNSASIKVNEILESFQNFFTPAGKSSAARLLAFASMQFVLLKGEFSVSRVCALIVSILLYSGKSLTDIGSEIKYVLGLCTENAEDREELKNVANSEIGSIDFLEPILNNISNLAPLVSGLVVLVATSVMGINCSMADLASSMSKIKRIGDGASCVTSWVKSILEWVVDRYYKHVYGCSKKEKELFDQLPEFERLRNEVYTVCALKIDDFYKSKELCDRVKTLYSDFQRLGKFIFSRDRLMSKELQYAFSTLERKFLPFYESVSSSPLFMNVTRSRPCTIYFYGKPGVGKSNCINFLAAKLVRKLYPDRKFNGENSVMWSRRVENEFHDGYAHQPVVQFDDFLQAVDSQSKPNPEIRELIYMVNDAPYQLHMSDVKEKKNVYFDSEHVFVSSNMKVPAAVSIHDVNALRRRFNFGVEVKVRPEFGAYYGMRPRGYYRVDPTKTKSTLDTDVYEFHLYDVCTGENLVEDGSPVVLNFQQFFNRYVDYYRTVRARDISTRDLIYAALDEDYDAEAEISLSIGQTFESAMAWLNPRIETNLESDVASEIAEMASSEPDNVMSDKDDVEGFLASFLSKKGSIIEGVKSKTQEIHQELGKVYDHCITALHKRWETIKQTVDTEKWMLLAAVGAIGVAIGYCMWPRGGCRLKPDTGCLFSRVCAKQCKKCDYLKEVCGNVLSLQDIIFTRTEWNYRASAILARDEPAYNSVKTYFYNKLQDLSADVELSRPSARRARVERYGSETVGVARVERYGSEKVNAARVERYGNEPVGVARVESARRARKAKSERYGSEPVHVADVEISAGSSFDFQSLTAARQQYLKVMLRNQVILQIGGRDGLANFLRGRTIIVNRHYMPFIESNGGFEVRNPGCSEGTFVRTNECVFKNVNRKGQEQDLMLVRLPKCIPSRPDITSLIIEASAHNNVEDAGGVFLRWKQENGITSLRETILDEVRCADVDAISNGTTYHVRRGYSYAKCSAPGECGGLLFTQSTRAQGKLIGLHACATSRNSYAEALEKQVILDALDEIEDKIVSAEMGGEVVAFERFDVGDVIHCGELEPTRASTKTQIKPSPLNGVLAAPKMKPAYLGKFRKDGELHDPLRKGLMKVGGSQKRIDPKLLKLAVHDVKRLIKAEMDRPIHGVLTHDQSIMGVEDDDMIGPIVRSTSAGYPWVLGKDPKYPGKKQWLNQIVNGKLTDDYKLDDPELLEAIEKRIAQAKKGIRTPTIYSACLKDERRPIAKVDAGKTRVFAGAPMDFVLCARRYYSDFIASMMANRIYVESAVGIDCHSEWSELVNFLRGKGDNVVAGDFSNFDGSLLSEVMWEIFGIIDNWYGDGEENSLVREVLFEEIANSFVLCDGHLMQWTHSQPSGNPLTVIINSMFQMIMFRVAYLDLKLQQGLPFICDFRDNVRMAVFGDDGVLSVSDAVVDWFNQKSITESLAKYGLTYTDEAKSGAEYTTRRLQDVSFLKRGFLFEGGIWRAPLDRDVLYEMCLWYKGPHATSQTLLNCEDALREAAVHGEAFYREFSQEMEFALEECGMTLSVLTYEEQLEALYHHLS